MKIEYPYSATPLDVDERVGLIPKHITTQTELNEWEQANILEAELWLDRFYYEEGKGKNYICIHKLLDVAFMQQVHRKMFNKTWKWAGTFRKTDKNIGVDWLTIRIRLKDLLEDVRYQVEHHSYGIDEIAARLHHRLVFIHPYPNGNGRHARCMTNIFLKACQQLVFTWGSKNLTEPSEIRKDYINALRAADKGNYEALLNFVRK